jgi:hypothetical protein
MKSATTTTHSLRTQADQLRRRCKAALARHKARAAAAGEVIDYDLEDLLKLVQAVRPMLAVSRGRLVCLSTPFGKRGFFFEEWDELARPWQRIKITAEQCPRITPEFLAEERQALGERWFKQEYLCSFEDAVAALFAYEDLMAACHNDVAPLALPE